MRADLYAIAEHWPRDLTATAFDEHLRLAHAAAAAERARIVAVIRAKAGAIRAACNLGSHATRAAALSKLADELENET